MSLRNDDPIAIDRARTLRREMTSLERVLWHRIRNEQIGFRFRRQYAAIPHYTLDFYYPSVKVCVEIDGPRHVPEKDARRDALLAEYGVLTIRFSSQEVYDDIEPVIGRIVRECAARQRTPSPTVFHAGARSHPSARASLQGEPSPK